MRIVVKRCEINRLKSTVKVNRERERPIAENRIFIERVRERKKEELSVRA